MSSSSTFDMSRVVIELENISQRFRLIQERPDTVRELFAKLFRSNVRYSSFEALSDVSLTVYAGETLGILGHNGSGKSTLLKIISGVYRVSSGQVRVHGAVAPLIELGAGFHPELTGRENILLNGLLMGYSKRDMQEREGRILEFADLQPRFIDAPVKQYSSGMYMRLGFAIATEVNPDILVMDEILAVGDLTFQQKCFDRLQRFRESGATILLVSHSIDQVLEYCDRVIVLDKGKLIFDGSPHEGAELYRARHAPVPELVEADTGH